MRMSEQNRAAVWGPGGEVPLVLSHVIATVVGSSKCLAVIGHLTVSLLVGGYIVARIVQDPSRWCTGAAVAVLVFPALLPGAVIRRLTGRTTGSAVFGPRRHGACRASQSYHLE